MCSKYKYKSDKYPFMQKELLEKSLKTLNKMAIDLSNLVSIIYLFFFISFGPDNICILLINLQPEESGLLN